MFPTFIQSLFVLYAEVEEDYDSPYSYDPDAASTNSFLIPALLGMTLGLFEFSDLLVEYEKWKRLFHRPVEYQPIVCYDDVD